MAAHFLYLKMFPGDDRVLSRQTDPLSHRVPNKGVYVLTIAYEARVGQLGGYTLHVGWSLCSPKDQFTKKTGRSNAIDRMKDTGIKVPRREIDEYLHGHAVKWLAENVEGFRAEHVVREMATSYLLRLAYIGWI